jgi:hypothetical protein
MGTALNPFRSLPYIRMYGKVSRSFFLSSLFYIDHVMTTICQFIEDSATPTQLRDPAEQASGGEVANQDEYIYRRRFSST